MQTEGLGEEKNLGTDREEAIVGDEQAADGSVGMGVGGEDDLLGGPIEELNDTIGLTNLRNHQQSPGEGGNTNQELSRSVHSKGDLFSKGLVELVLAQVDEELRATVLLRSELVANNRSALKGCERMRTSAGNNRPKGTTKGCKRRKKRVEERRSGSLLDWKSRVI